MAEPIPAVPATLPPDTMWTLLICTMRYAMGRSSYIVGSTIDLIRRHAASLTQAQRDQMISEVREELALRERLGKTLGMDMDHRAWTRFANQGIPVPEATPTAPHACNDPECPDHATARPAEAAEADADEDVPTEDEFDPSRAHPALHAAFRRVAEIQRDSTWFRPLVPAPMYVELSHHTDDAEFIADQLTMYLTADDESRADMDAFFLPAGNGKSGMDHLHEITARETLKLASAQACTAAQTPDGRHSIDYYDDGGHDGPGTCLWCGERAPDPTT